MVVDTLNARYTSVLENKTFYFCCLRCKETFDHPQTFTRLGREILIAPDARDSLRRRSKERNQLTYTSILASFRSSERRMALAVFRSINIHS